MIIKENLKLKKIYILLYQYTSEAVVHYEPKFIDILEKLVFLR